MSKIKTGKMKKYRVYVKPAVKYYEVEANNEQEAEEKAFEIYNDYAYQLGEFLQFIPKLVKRFNTFNSSN